MPRHNVLRLLFKTVFSQLDYGRIHTMTPCLRLHWNIPLAITGRLTMTFVMVKLEETSLPQRRLSHYTFQYKRIARQELGTWIGTCPLAGSCLTPALARGMEHATVARLTALVACGPVNRKSDAPSQRSQVQPSAVRPVKRSRRLA